MLLISNDTRYTRQTDTSRMVWNKVANVIITQTSMSLVHTGWRSSPSRIACPITKRSSYTHEASNEPMLMLAESLVRRLTGRFWSFSNMKWNFDFFFSSRSMLDTDLDCFTEKSQVYPLHLTRFIKRLQQSKYPDNEWIWKSLYPHAQSSYSSMSNSGI